MTLPDRPKRKWLPIEAYRFLAVAALRAHGEAGLSKRELAWATRANHYVITRVLRELSDAGHVAIDGLPHGGYRVRLTAPGREFNERHHQYASETYGPAFDAHFRFGKRPDWSRF
ncbi:MAG: hypothetical protein HYT80_07660 [Euryarchaeota archaeon]|nr:hypothetical protein [Euryarchaeota archaeon]